MNVNSINKFKEVVDSNFSREKIDAKKSKNQTLEDVAKDFESLFVYQMMKSSRKQNSLKESFLIVQLIHTFLF